MKTRVVCLATHAPFESQRKPGFRRDVQDARDHFDKRGIDAVFFWGLSASKLGLVATKPSTLGAAGILKPHRVGVWIGQRAMWAACLLLPDEPVLLLEDDARFPEDWQTKVDEVFEHVPDDWQMLFIGSCCTSTWPKTHISGPVYEVHWPVCLHAYFVRNRAVLERLVVNADDRSIHDPIDLTTKHAMQKLRVYTVLPRIVEQADIEDLEP